jgi:hypothetical protein
MKQWIVGYLLGLLLIFNSFSLSQPLSAINLLVGVFFWLVILGAYYGKR